MTRTHPRALGQAGGGPPWPDILEGPGRKAAAVLANLLGARGDASPALRYLLRFACLMGLLCQWVPRSITRVPRKRPNHFGQRLWGGATGAEILRPDLRHGAGFRAGRIIRRAAAAETARPICQDAPGGPAARPGLHGLRFSIELIPLSIANSFAYDVNKLEENVSSRSPRAGHFGRAATSSGFTRPGRALEPE